MADEPQLLQQVLDAPDEDAPRLEYAHWCQQEGTAALTARARFIEAQIGETYVEADDARALRSAARAELAAYGATWTAPLRAAVTLAGEPVFDRGFVELVRLSARDFLDHASALFALAPIRHLDLVGVTAVADELFASPSLAGIRSLALDRASLEDEHLELLAASPHLGSLRWLSIAHNAIGMAGAEALAASTLLPRLAYVRFHGNRIDPGERQGHDQGVVVETWLPPEGEALEARFGPLRWLHTDARTLMDVIPDRFRIG